MVDSAQLVTDLSAALAQCELRLASMESALAEQNSHVIEVQKSENEMRRTAAAQCADLRKAGARVELLEAHLALAIPEGFEIVHTDDGRLYYANYETRESSWEPPVGPTRIYQSQSCAFRANASSSHEPYVGVFSELGEADTVDRFQ